MDESRVTVLMNRIVFETHRYGLRSCGISRDALTRETGEREGFVRRCRDASVSPDFTDSISKGVFPTEALLTVAAHEGRIGREEYGELMRMRACALSYLNSPEGREAVLDGTAVSSDTLVEWEGIINTIVVK